MKDWKTEWQAGGLEEKGEGRRNKEKDKENMKAWGELKKGRDNKVESKIKQKPGDKRFEEKKWGPGGQDGTRKRRWRTKR